MFKTASIALALAMLAGFHPLAQAQAGGCLLKPEVLSQTVGGKFSAGKDEGSQGMLGHGCSYRSDKGQTVWLITLKPADFGMPAPQILKMTDPGQWNPVAADADGAWTQTPRPDVPAFPSVAYERKGVLVKLRMLGADSDPKTVADLNSKLLKLPRLP